MNRAHRYIPISAVEVASFPHRLYWKYEITLSQQWDRLPVRPSALSHPGDAAAQDKKSQTVTRAGSQPSTKGPAEYFTGNVRVDPLFAANESAPYSGGYVTFEPGARSNWHTHPVGQRFIVTHGVGRTQEWGGPIVEIRAGDHVWCPPGVKHWHGARRRPE